MNGVALKAKDLQNANNQEVNEQIRNASVVYIWHDTIDAMGIRLQRKIKRLRLPKCNH
uniref:Putative cytoplasmic protein n=1 Tax=Escherichia coli TaxID=562 RepID=A0A6G6AMS7_ECOLX|nr:putative cytoplasmic protein [Escherichia coli]